MQDMNRRIFPLFILLCLSGCTYADRVKIGDYLYKISQEQPQTSWEDSYTEGYRNAMERAQTLNSEELRHAPPPPSSSARAYRRGFHDALFDAISMTKEEMESEALWGPDDIPSH